MILHYQVAKSPTRWPLSHRATQDSRKGIKGFAVWPLNTPPPHLPNHLGRWEWPGTQKSPTEFTLKLFQSKACVTKPDRVKQEKNPRQEPECYIKLCPDGSFINTFFCNTIIIIFKKNSRFPYPHLGSGAKGLRYWPISLMPCDYIWLQREKRYMKKKKRKRGWEHFLLLIPLSSPVVSPRAGEEGRSRRSGQGAGGREAPPRRSPTQGDGPFLTSLLQEKRRPASPRPRIKQPLWSARPPVSVLMEIRACLPATLSARMQSWSAFPAGTADDNDVLKGSWAFIVYSPFSAFLFFFLSFFFFFFTPNNDF